MAEPAKTKDAKAAEEPQADLAVDPNLSVLHEHSTYEQGPTPDENPPPGPTTIQTLGKPAES